MIDRKEYYNEPTWPLYNAVKNDCTDMAKQLILNPDLLRKTNKQQKGGSESSGLPKPRTDRALGLGKAAADNKEDLITLIDGDNNDTDHRHRPNYSHIDQWNEGLYVDAEAIVAGSMYYENSAWTRLGKHIADHLDKYADPAQSAGLDDLIKYIDCGARYDAKIEKSIAQFLTSGRTSIRREYRDFAQNLLTALVDRHPDCNWEQVYHSVENEGLRWVYKALSPVVPRSKQAAKRL